MYSERRGHHDRNRRGHLQKGEMKDEQGMPQLRAVFNLAAQHFCKSGGRATQIGKCNNS